MDKFKRSVGQIVQNYTVEDNGEDVEVPDAPVLVAQDSLDNVLLPKHSMAKARSSSASTERWRRALVLGQAITRLGRTRREKERRGRVDRILDSLLCCTRR